MIRREHSYKAMVSSDWSECLSPCGPFDCIRFTYPELKNPLTDIFHRYTGNRMTLKKAAEEIEAILPRQLSIAQMDAYLDAEFETYPGLADLVRWCQSNDVLLMINSTGMIGYFQRAVARGLLPAIAVLSAHPLIRYPSAPSDPDHILELYETSDKGRNTAAVAKAAGVALNRVIVMGDSGGDGPHFEWGARVGATLVGSMTKTSLEKFCRRKQIRIHHRFGQAEPFPEGTGEPAMILPDFRDLIATLKTIVAKHGA